MDVQGELASLAGMALGVDWPGGSEEGKCKGEEAIVVKIKHVLASTQMRRQSQAHQPSGHNGIAYPVLNPNEGSYPILDAYDISTCFHDLHVQITQDEIAKPTPSSIQNAWAQLLQTFNGVGFHSFEAPRTALLGMVAYGVRLPLASLSLSCALDLIRFASCL